MTRLLSCILVIAAASLTVAATFRSQGPGRETILRDGPYRVVLGKPMGQQSWRVGSLYSEQKQLTELFNQLAIDGLTPVFTNVMTERVEGLLPQDRLLVVCTRN